MLKPIAAVIILVSALSGPVFGEQKNSTAKKAGEGEKPAELAWRYGGILKVNLDATFQTDLHGSYDGADLNAGLKPFALQRNRVGVQGTAFKHIEFEVTRDVTEKDVAEGRLAKSPWKDLNVNLTYFKRAQIQAGKFKIPFGLDALTGATRNDFVYRSLGGDYLAPGRGTGVMVHGKLLNRGLNYSVGVFGDDGDNATTSKARGGDRTLAARVTGTPLRRISAGGLGRVEFGTAFALSGVSDDSDGSFMPKGLRGRTVVTSDAFFQPVYVNGRRARWEGDVHWAGGPADLRAEYTRVTDERRGQGYADENLPDVRYQSWYVRGTYFVTGDRRTRGAVQAVGRYERIWFDSVGGSDEPARTPRAETIFPNGDRVVTVGANVTLNRYMTIQLNVIREAVSDRDRNPVAGGAPFWSRVLRFQFAL